MGGAVQSTIRNITHRKARDEWDSATVRFSETSEAGTFSRVATLQELKDTAGCQGGPTMTTDETLILQFQKGSREAFEELFARYRGPLYGFFRRRLNGDQRAEDLMQETFVAVIRARARYEPRALVRTYLYGIAMNLLAAERRRQFRDSPGGQLAPEPATHDAPDAVLWIRQALAKLDEAEREILMLREYEQLSYAEIAELVNVPVNTVRSRLFRARMALKECLEPEPKIQQVAAPNAERARLAQAEGEAI
jgi:RNA polymerase sigma-70 factor (ECF subfamily)